MANELAPLVKFDGLIYLGLANVLGVDIICHLIAGTKESRCEICIPKFSMTQQLRPYAQEGTVTDYLLLYQPESNQAHSPGLG